MPPRLPDAERRDYYVGLRFTEAETQAAQDVADAEHGGNRSHALRALVAEALTARATPALTADTELAALRWRTGRKVGRTIYAQLGERPGDADLLIGVMDSVSLAIAAVRAHNAEHEREIAGS